MIDNKEARLVVWELLYNQMYEGSWVAFADQNFQTYGDQPPPGVPRDGVMGTAPTNITWVATVDFGANRYIVTLYARVDPTSGAVKLHGARVQDWLCDSYSLSEGDLSHFPSISPAMKADAIAQLQKAATLL